MNKHKVGAFLLLNAFSILSQTGLSQEQTRGIRKISIHPFADRASSYQLNHLMSSIPFKESTLMLKDQVHSVLKMHQLDQHIQIESHSLSNMNLVTNHSFRSESFTFSIDQFPLCQFQLKAHQSPQGYVSIFGDIPDITVGSDYRIEDWPSVEVAFSQIQSFALAEKQVFLDLSLLNHRPCLWVHDGEIVTAWQVQAGVGTVMYQAVADENTIYDWQPMFFNATGKATIYNKNPSDGVLSEFSLRDMTADANGGCYLENTYFKTRINEFDTNQRAYSDSCTFNFTPETSEFQETSLFTNANRVLEWLESYGYSNFGNVPIIVEAHAVFRYNGISDINNALYRPKANQAGYENPAILVGDGDGSLLQNLSIDSDVVSHELAHHVVYHTITNIQGESLVLHEGLADFFTFLRTGDACLGESICPASSSGICAIRNRCLRTAENDLTLTSENLPEQAHLRGQLISGYLWDLKTKDGIPDSVLIPLVLKAINLFVANSGYQHFILGLMAVDNAEYESNYCDKIYNRALARGLAGVLEGISCSNINTLAARGDDVESMINGTTSQTPLPEGQVGASKSSSWCGSVGAPINGGWSLFILLGLPLFVLFWRNRM